MKKTEITRRVFFIIGLIALIAGTFDPLYGAPILAAGSMLVSITLYLDHEHHWRSYFVSFLMIMFGITFMYIFSSKGGIGGDSGNPLWWGALILPYPIGWLFTIILLVIKGYKYLRTKNNH